MFAPRTSARAIARSFRASPSSAARSTRLPISRSYAQTRTRTQPEPPISSDGGMGQTLFILAATLTVGGVILSQRGKVTNEASVKAARAKAGDGVTRDTKKVEEPIYVREEESKASVPDIVIKKEEEAEESVQGDNAASQGAFNEETGEINWDCPCLGGMADGPCGEDFKAAFSCFVYSEAEPKGVDCVEKFKGMQDCFRLHPEIYGEEIEDDERTNQPGAFDSDEPGEEIGAVDAPPTRAEAVAVDPAVIKAQAAEGASTGTL